MSIPRFAVPFFVLCLSAVACSEAVPVASEGAYVVSFLATPSAGKTCKITSHNAQIGGVTASALDLLKKDTVDGAKVQCSVTANGASFSASGIIEDGSGNHFDFVIPSISASATEAAPALGNIGFRSPTTVALYRAPAETACKFWFTGNEQLAAGLIWVSFKCDAISDLGHDSSCQITAGSALAMQNCDQ